MCGMARPFRYATLRLEHLRGYASKGTGRSPTIVRYCILESRRLSAHQMAQPKNFSSKMNTITKLAPTILICLAFNLTSAQKPNDEDQDDESSRQIVLDRFNKARPMSEASAGMGAVTSGMSATKAPLYRRMGATRITRRRGAPAPATEEIGITIWRLRPSRDTDHPAYHDGEW